MPTHWPNRRRLKSPSAALILAAGLAACHHDEAGTTASAPPVSPTATAAAPAPLTASPSVVVAGGAAWTRTRSVPVRITPPSGAVRYCVQTGGGSTAATCAPNAVYAAVPALTDGAFVKTAVALGAGEGNRWVGVSFRAAAGTALVGDTLLDDVGVDTTAPTVGLSVTQSEVDGRVPLKFTMTDAGSGIARWDLYRSTTAAVAACKVTPTVERAAFGTSAGTGWTDEPVVNGTTRYYALCAQDGAGNNSTVKGLKVVVKPDLAPPEIASTAKLVLSKAVVAAASGDLTASIAPAPTDGSAIQVCFSTTGGASCSGAPAVWQPLGASMAVTLPAVDGTKTVTAVVADVHGNIASRRLTATVALDMTPPVAGAISVVSDTASGSTGRVIARMTKKPTDKLLADWALRAAVGTSMPASCDSGAVVASGGTVPSAVGAVIGGAPIPGLSPGLDHSFVWCAFDKAGNATPSAVVTAKASGTACVAATTCSGHGSCNANGSCACDTGYRAAANGCAAIACAANERWSGTACVACPPGTRSAGGAASTCTPCTVGGVFSCQEPVLPATPFNYASPTLPWYFANPSFANWDNTPVDNVLDDDVATLGRVLFYDVNLSANNTVSCASCHRQEVAFSDPNRFSKGFAGELTGRNSMSVVETRFYKPGRFFWDHRAESLEAQALAPIQSSVEMGLTLEQAVSKVDALPYYDDLFVKAFGDAFVTSDRIAKAIAQFERSILSYRSKYDAGMSQVTDIDQPFPNFTLQENRGKAVFIDGANNCRKCHLKSGIPEQPNFAVFMNDTPKNIGLDGPDDTENLGLGAIFNDPTLNGVYKSPTLRNIMVTGPYMHDGRLPDMDAVLDHYATGIKANPNLDRILDKSDGTPNFIVLSTEDREALKAFFHTLTDEELLHDPKWSNPFPPPPAPPGGNPPPPAP